MKKLIKIAGIAALGLASSQSARAQSSDSSKPWSVSATLRHFYDDNIFTASQTALDAQGESLKRGSLGFDIIPDAHFNLNRGQTTLGLGYAYTLRYFQERPDEKIDQAHDANLKLTHEFTSRLRLEIHDSLVIAQEPSVMDRNVITSPLRSEGNNLRNTGGANVAFGVSESLELVADIGSTLYDYEQDGSDPDLKNASGNTIAPSRSALLDRTENSAGLNLRYQLLSETIGVLGYTFTSIDYSSDEALNPLTPDFAKIYSKDRNNDRHNIFTGVDHTFTPKLNASVRVGGEMVEYSNASAAATADTDSVSPYVDARLAYGYSKDDSIVVGVRHGYSQTDAGIYGQYLGLGNNTERLVLNAKTTSLYGQIGYHLTANISAKLNAQYQQSEFQIADQSGLSDEYFIIGLSSAYKINRWFSLEAGYNYDVLESTFQAGREYDRNRVFVGVVAQY